MGSRLKLKDLAYIAGFLDGDGSLMIQVKKRSDSKKGIRIMLTICFYQDTRHEEPLLWIRSVLKVGYFSRRKDGISELRINGFKTVERVLIQLLPFIKFKNKQAKMLLKSAHILQSKMGNDQKKQLVENILAVQSENYVAKRKKTKSELFQLLGLTP